MSKRAPAGSWNPHSESAWQRKLGPVQIEELKQIGPDQFAEKYKYSAQGRRALHRAYSAHTKGAPTPGQFKAPVPVQTEVPDLSLEEQVQRAQILIEQMAQVIGSTLLTLADEMKAAREAR